VLRFAVEAVFLGLLAAALVVADRSALEIAGVMLLGWLVVALYEWAATRERAHYGRGLPPRYYVPQVSLPPPRPLEQLPYAYPAAEEPTWIASPAMLADWPVASAPQAGSAEDTIVDEALFAAIAEESGKEAPPTGQPELAEAEPEAEVLLEPELAPAGSAADANGEAGLGAAAAAVVVAQPEHEEERLAPAPGASARYTFDPFVESAPKRRFRRGSADEAAGIEVAATPPAPVGLPGRARES
jgi:hypothetical protein